MPGINNAETFDVLNKGITARRDSSSLAAGNRGAAQAVPVSDLDQRHACFVEALGDRFHLLHCDLVTHGVHAIAQRHVVSLDPDAFEIHYAASVVDEERNGKFAAIISAVRAAAAVMMSRLPAYFCR